MYPNPQQEGVAAYSEQLTATPEQLLHKYIPLVKRITSRIINLVGQPISREDMEQAGLMGLWEAANRFELGRGGQFESFASQRIRGAIIDELRRNDWRPRPLQKKAQQIRDIIATLSQPGHPQPGEQMIADALSMSLDEYRQTLNDIQASQLLSFEEDSASGETREDPLHEHFARQQQKELLTRALKTLPHREQVLLHLHYNIGMNLTEIAQVFEVGRARACQLHKQALLRVRAQFTETCGEIHV
ncbi:sigma-70 family RNA polymerase sigma factor [Dongshaea marina]|uniref:sigma-70 family RNA polymerase sigma factor n=1 Tax=Dongshaea marina TaxID=2047966 RepID=UPI000D3E6A87|nr:RNA polymerase sigma factor FliA [Dongshaea marina]